MSDFSIRTSTLRTRLSSAFDKNGLDITSDAIQKSELADYLLNDLQDDINSLKSQQQDAQIDFNGIKLPVGETYENVSDALKKLQQQQAVLAKMLFVEDNNGETLFDKLDTNGNGLSKAEFNTLDAVDSSSGTITNDDIEAWFSDESVADDFADTLTSSEKNDLADDQDVSTSGNSSSTSLLLGLLTGKTDMGSIFSSLLGGDDDDSDSNLMTQLLPMLMGGNSGGSSLSSILPFLLLSDSEDFDSSDSLENILPIMFLSQGGGTQGSSMSSLLP